MSQRNPNEIRTVAARILPAPGRWVIDAAHSRIGFAVRHATVTTVRGRFTEFAGTIDIGVDPAASALAVTIQADSFTTAMPIRDADVRGPDWLDAPQYPTIEFVSTNLDLNGPIGRVAGDLTIHGVTRPVVLDAEYAGLASTPTGEQRAGFAAVTRLDRRDFGIARNVPLATGGFFVSYDVAIELDVSAIPDGALQATPAVDGPA